MASTFLTRLKVGGKLVDAKGVSRLYRGRVAGWHLLLVVLAALRRGRRRGRAGRRRPGLDGDRPPAGVRRRRLGPRTASRDLFPLPHRLARLGLPGARARRRCSAAARSTATVPTTCAARSPDAGQDKRDLQPSRSAQQGRSHDDTFADRADRRRWSPARCAALTVVLVATRAAAPTTDGVASDAASGRRAGCTGRVQLDRRLRRPAAGRDASSSPAGSQPDGAPAADPTTRRAGRRAARLALLGTTSTGGADAAATSSPGRVQHACGCCAWQRRRAAGAWSWWSSGPVAGRRPARRLQTSRDRSVPPLDGAGAASSWPARPAAPARGGLVAAVRADRGPPSAVSTVDRADRTVGQVATCSRWPRRPAAAPASTAPATPPTARSRRCPSG